MINMLRLSPMSSTDSLSPSSAKRFASTAAGLTSDSSLAFDSATETSSLDSSIDGDSISRSSRFCVESEAGSLLSSVSLLTVAPIGLLGAATTVDGSADSNVLKSTYTAVQGNNRCWCFSRQNPRVRFVFLQIAQTGVFLWNGFLTQKGCHCTILQIMGLSFTIFPVSSSIQESSIVMQMYSTVHGGAVCFSRTRQVSRVLKFFLHASHTAKRVSGNLTFRD